MEDLLETKHEEKKMSDEIGTGQAGTYALLLDSLRAGNRGVGGGGEGGTNGYGAYAGPTAIRADILANRDIGNTGIENLQREFANITSRDQVSGGFNRVCDKMDSNAIRQSDQMFALARDVDNKFSVVTEQNHGIALGMKDQEIRSTERYCDLKAGQATVIAKMDANKEYGELFSENQSLKTQIACGCVTGCSTPCGGHHGRG